MSRQLTPDQHDLIVNLLGRGFSKAETARRAGVHYNTISRYASRAKTPRLLNDPAKEALEDFGLFRRRYMGRVATPWQIDAANRIVSLLATPDEEYLVINVPPGAGKTTILSDVATWCIVRDRAVRILWGSAAQTTASDSTRRIMNELTREDITRAKTTDVRLGLAVDGESTLIADYGSFKPATDMWRKEKFVVAQVDGRTAQEKEATVAAFGRDSTFIGGRYDLVIWDDLVSEKTLTSQDTRDKLIDFWDTYAETRIEPGGLVVLCGQRLASDDLYRYVLDLKKGDVTTLDLPPEDERDPDAGERKYHHVIYPAHDDERCKVGPGEQRHPDHAHGAPYWPDGCLLDPRRLPWQKLATIRVNKAERFAITYQQQDTDPAGALVHPLWLEGGLGTDGIDHPGCKDRDRAIGQYPKNLGPTINYITVDPSPTKFWAVELWAYQPDSDLRFLIDIERGMMDAPDFLDHNSTTGQFYGLLEDWTQRAAEMGRPINYLIVETNAAQRFMTQYDFFRRWQSTRNVRLIPHTTNRNKADPEYGVQMLAPLYQMGKVRLPALPGHMWTNKKIQIFARELTRWPRSATDDQVMSQWFGEFNLRIMHNPNQGKVYRLRPNDIIARHARRGIA